MSVVAEPAVFPISGDRAERRTGVQQDVQKFAEAALAESKREGLWLAVRARWVALAVIAATLPILNPHWDVLYYIASLGLFAAIAWAQLKVGKAGLSRPELFLMFCDLALLTFLAVVPNPWAPVDWPIGMQFRFNTFIYFFVLLATATLAYSWRTVIAMGTWAAGLWAIGVGWAWYFHADTHAALAERVRAAVGSDVRMFAMIDPTAINIPARLQEVVVFVIVALTLAVAVRRSNALLVSHAGIERERTNLARYFSPNVVEQLSRNDEPLKQVRTENVAVLFTDIVGFTAYALPGRNQTSRHSREEESDGQRDRSAEEKRGRFHANPLVILTVLQRVDRVVGDCPTDGCAEKPPGLYIDGGPRGSPCHDRTPAEGDAQDCLWHVNPPFAKRVDGRQK